MQQPVVTGVLAVVAAAGLAAILWQYRQLRRAEGPAVVQIAVRMAIAHGVGGLALVALLIAYTL
ncbi:hypothetical protein [Phenylobacterium sp. J367]|uniref:hypothetical protein n=1 Tax=Phenylobacterium sp. J367 TaxID=2898435 RepID=UPI002150DD1F|nr:hypothetical protein [Phenylobacterium sp. J367]MCR5879787.1 hypothetical protein [Phenylobacterium sp. J367]